ncbi:MAG TPA: HAD family hydrolase [Armatimonadetes bacterium]|jgi:YrbI family 3-deoxy-D-manno-octulosonate 8-phosphate phosphatase|nr:HAD family hydrolase [Armatimonadota bacterium]
MQLRNEGRVRMLATDCDGCLTDGGMYFGPNGQAMKRFDVKDGYGLKMLQRSGVLVAWITADESAITRARFEALQGDILLDGVSDKLDALRTAVSRAGCELADVVYLGDDLNDLTVGQAAGSFVAPADAVAEVLAAADVITTRPGGHGAVRQVCEAIIAHNKRLDGDTDA